MKNKCAQLSLLGTVPNAEEICEIQLLKLIHKVISTDVREKDIQKFMPTIMAEFEALSKEEVIKHFVSTEFNRFIEYYERAGDLNASASKGDDRNDDRPNRRERKTNETESGKTRFFVSIGRRDGLNPGGLLRLICDATGLNSGNVGRIDIMTSYSFFEADNEYSDNILKKVNGAEYEGNAVSIEITKDKPSGGGNRGGGERSGGDRRGGNSFGGKFQGGRDGGARRGESGGRSEGGYRGGSSSNRSDDRPRRESSGGSSRSEGGYRSEGRSEGGNQKRRKI